MSNILTKRVWEWLRNTIWENIRRRRRRKHDIGRKYVWKYEKDSIWFWDRKIVFQSMTQIVTEIVIRLCNKIVWDRLYEREYEKDSKKVLEIMWKR